jgi:hypothetical protein
MSAKLITDELINERLEAKGFGEKQANDEDLVRKAVLDHYGYKLTDDWPIHNNADFFIYEESTQDGYEVYVATANPDKISICEDVYYYDSDLGDTLAEAMRYGSGDPEYPETIYVSDLEAQYIDDAMQNEFQYLAERYEEEVINELEEEGYVHEDED